MKSFNFLLPAPRDSCSLCEQRPLEHSTKSVSWSCEITQPQEAYSVAQAQVQNL